MISDKSKPISRETTRGDEGSRANGVDPPMLHPGAPRHQWLPGDFITEANAYDAYGHVLEDKELRHARYSGRLGFMRRKRTIFYRRDELDAFVSSLLAQDYVGPCPSSTEQVPKYELPVRPLERVCTKASTLDNPERLRRVLKLLT